MWQVYLYLANERQGQERRTAQTTHRPRRWPFARRVSGAPTTRDRRETVDRARAD